MMTMIGPLGFGVPLALLGLLALPLVWLVVRAFPKRPQNTFFPPTEILRQIPQTEETPAKAPPWLAILRALALGLVILGLSAPVLNPPQTKDIRDLLIVIDNGWSAAPIWPQISQEAIATARAASGEVRLVFTVPENGDLATIDALTPARAAAQIAAQAPQPILADHAATAARIAKLPKGQRILWYSDGIGRPGTQDFGAALTNIGQVKLRVIATPVVAIARGEATSQGYNVGLLASRSATANVQLEAVNARTGVIASSQVPTSEAGTSLTVESALTRDIAALRIGNVRSAGGVFLLDAFDRRVRAGLVASRQDDQPLLSDAHYLEEAIGPFAEITRGEIERLAGSGLDAILLPDAGALPERDEAALVRFVTNGGLLVRFAGPRLVAGGASKLLPAPISSEARALKGALAWDNAGSISAFDSTGPFAGLPLPKDARVNQVAVYDTTQSPVQTATAPQIWARLGDDTPLVSAAPMGRGWQVLFHTTAGPAWSDVAFSGLQVSMLRRVLARAASSNIPAKAIAPTTSLKPVLVLDGYGNFRAPSPAVLAVAPQNAVSAKPDARHPPGIYEGGGSRLILQAAGPDTTLPALPALSGLERISRAQDSQVAFGPPLIWIGLAILIADMVLALIFAGGLSAPKTWRFPTKALTLVALALLILPPLSARAQSPPMPEPKAATRTSLGDLSLAYIRTGDSATDARARAGLEGLTRVLAARTSVEPGPVIGVDPATDDLALFPLLYWLLPDRPIETSAESARALDRFMKTGGVLFVDSRGAGRAPDAARAIARAALRGIEAPPIEQVPEGHVLSKAFYLLRGYPGRYQNAKLWVETKASAEASANDGVSPLIVGDGDWASAWANASSSVSFGAMDNGDRNTEIATRVGVNVVLYALTGNYKADQVHFEALLNRLIPRGMNGGMGVPPPQFERPR
jgi:hypothetical protein